jgi:3-oxoacyl-[acyl-carrier-protein] synthase-1
MVTPVGLDAPSTAAAMRAGMGRFREVPVYDKESEPIVTARVDDGDLPPLHHAVAARGTSSEREVRLLRLAQLALSEAVAPFAPRAPWPLFLAVPEAHPGLEDPVPRDLLERLSLQASVSLDPAESRVFREGRAGGLHALGAALDALAAGRVPAAVVGGVDTYDDLPLLRALIEENRVQVSTPADRMFPGEGAAFLVLTRPDSTGGLHAEGGGPLPSFGAVQGLGLGFERGHLYSPEIYRGDGLSEAFSALFAAIGPVGDPQAPPIRTVYTSFNGESFWAKEWGVAHVRNQARFRERLRVEHPADRIGDTGAAAGPLLLALAAIGLSRGYLKDPCLVFCSSDRGARGAAMLRAPAARPGA